LFKFNTDKQLATYFAAMLLTFGHTLYIGGSPLYIIKAFSSVLISLNDYFFTICNDLCNFWVYGL